MLQCFPGICYCQLMEPDYSGMRLEELCFGPLVGHYGEKRDYCLDFITSKEEICSPRPLVLFLHGGGFSHHADKRQWFIARFARDFTNAGWAVAVPDYPVYERRDEFREHSLEKACLKVSEAVEKALGYLEGRKKELSVDTSRLALAGASAGGMGAFYYLSSHPGVFRAFINLWGVPWALPSLQLFPPTLSVHGTADPLVPYSLEGLAEAEFERLGIRHELITLEGARHTPIDRYGEFIPKVMEHLETARAF